MESYLLYISDADANAILPGLQQNKSDNQEIDVTELKNLVHTSINYSDVIIPSSSQAQQQQDKAKSSRSWTKNKRDTSAKYLEKIAYRRTTFSKKSNGIKKYVVDFAQQRELKSKLLSIIPTIRRFKHIIQKLFWYCLNLKITIVLSKNLLLELHLRLHLFIYHLKG